MHRIAPEHECLTLVIAAYNEADALPALQPRIAAALDAAEREGLQARVLYVDDGSRDGTWNVLRGIANGDRRVSLLRLSRNFGKEAALTAGLDRIERGAAPVHPLTPTLSPKGERGLEPQSTLRGLLQVS